MLRIFKIAFFLTVVFHLFTSFSGNYEIPISENVKCHVGYCFDYSEKYEQARWVGYMLSGEEAVMNRSRFHRFIEDSSVVTGSASDTDYHQKVWFPGELKPWADCQGSAGKMRDAAYYSNTSPMDPNFDNGVWRILENTVRGWAVMFDTVYVVTGPILKAGLPQTDGNKVSVPEEFFKVVLVRNGFDLGAIGFILKNQDYESKGESVKRAVPIDSVEIATGLNFFSDLPDYLEDPVEASFDPEFWKTGSTSYMIKSSFTKENQCVATTIANDRCELMTECVTQLCWKHGCNDD